jgi:ubiquinone/menaquinone biosynthesis C-methylase UbiE
MKIALLLLAMAPVALPQAEHQHHPPRSSEEYLRVLNDPKRDAWQMPHAVLVALDLKPTEVVADIGAGAGYFARRFARHAAKVYAVDLDAKLLAAARKGAPPNLETVLAAPDDPKLPERSVDTAFFCNVLHHIDDRPAYLARLRKAIKPGGRVVNIDFYKKPLPVGPPERMKLTEEEVIADFEAAGFRKTKTVELLPYQYFLVFEPK